MLIKENGEWSKITALYVKNNGVWVQTPLTQLSGLVTTHICNYNGETGGDFMLSIIGPASMTGETCTYSLLRNGISIPSSRVVWSVVSGSTYATIDGNGVVTILSGASASQVTIMGSYAGKTKEKDITLTYANGVTSDTTTESETIETEDGTIERTTTTTEVTDASGNTTVVENVVEIITNNSGETTYIESSTTENPDGSSTNTSNTVNYDENGDVMGSSESEQTINADGSSTGSTTNFNENGQPVSGSNNSGDTDGNINTQEVEYDESGNTSVVSYEIDTSENPDGSKDYNGDGVNTEYYAFDVTRGFVVDMHFTVDCSNKPAGQDENHHNVLTAKRASPTPWYGFQIRQSTTNKYVQLGTQFSTGSNVNTKLNPAGLTGNTAEYNLQIIYNPTVSTDSFVCIDRTTGAILYRNNGKFPDIEDLKYIKVTVGYALDANGEPFRYSDIGVKHFSIRRLEPIVDPAISCDGTAVTITCETKGADIYYRLNEEGSYVLYTAAIPITADTIVEAYSTIGGFYTSNTVRAVCEYDAGVEEPVIYCDGENVTISCGTAGATIYYRKDQSGSYSVYTESFAITADTIVQAYAELGVKRSSTVTENCIYNPEHDFSLDYLTLKVTSAGTLCWCAVGVNSPKSVQYSLNGGAWTTWLPPTDDSSVSIDVEVGDEIRLKGTNTRYSSSNTSYMCFKDSTAVFDAEGNVMSLIYGDNFINNTALTGTYNFCSLFKQSNLVSAENLVLPATTLTPHCYRAMFANNELFAVAPELHATTLAESCYRYMFQDAAMTTAPELLAPTLVTDCYDGMFNNCANLNYIKCLATDISAASATTAWVTGVANSGTFVKNTNTVWSVGQSGIPTHWVVIDYGLANPSISCDGLSITLSCLTEGASIYYRLNESGEYALYSTPISITADTIVEAYSKLDAETSDIVRETCIYDDGIEEPVIYCDGEYVTMSCNTGGAFIYYRLNQTGTYTQYEEAIVITADTICEAYSEVDGRRSETVSANCIYDASLKAPIIECTGTEVIIACHSAGADIYYRLNQEGNYALYESPIGITANTVVQAYSELSGETSETVTETCIYDPTHDYSLDYLTFRVLSDGTIMWNSIGSGQAKTIQYSLNDGAWQTIVASSATTISVETGDVVRFRGTNASYAKDKSNYSGFEGGTASFDIEGNIMSLVYGSNFVGETALTGTYNFCSIFKLSNCVSAENLVMPAITLTNYCYRAMFSKCTSLVAAPALPATTLSKGCYWYMFEECAITNAPDLLAETLVAECYGYMFTGCRSLNSVKCMAITGFTTTNCKQNWLNNVASSGTFVKDGSVSVSTWTRGASGIPTSWLVYDDVEVLAPVIYCDGYNNVTITCETSGATIYYKRSDEEIYGVYASALTITATTTFNAYSELNGQESRVVTQTCEYISTIPFESSNRDLRTWNYNNAEVTTPYSVNSLDGHSSSYAKGTFNFETNFALRDAQPTYLWFQHADQSATIYVDNVLVEKHWGGYAAFFVDISNYVHAGTNTLKVALKNNEGNNLAPASGDFNFNATLGKVKLFTSPYVPATIYGYDGFHVTSEVSTSSATLNIRTSVPTGATISLTIDDGTYHFETSSASTGAEMVFTTTITNPHLWNGTLDPHLYTITMEIYHSGELYHRYVRPYGLRFYEYVFNDTSVLQSGDPYTGFLLNGSPYLLRGCCMHDDIVDKANALDDADYAQTFSIVQEIGANFLRLAHYPHPKETYDWCDRLGIIVQTEVPMVNILKSTQPEDYYTHLEGQHIDMVTQHYNHPCIVFWGLGNEFNAQMDSASFACTKLEYYRDIIRTYDTERLIGCVLNANSSNPRSTVGGADLDWYGCNIYVGWYSSTASNNPSSQLNTRFNNLRDKPIAYSEYGCGGTQRCHSDDYMTTTTRGNYARHDIEYMMWLHEGHIAAIKNYPQLIFTAQWQLFDIAVSNRNEGYTVCLDGENTSIDDSLRRLNDKGLVERDHVTKKDAFYLYKAEWNTQPFVHICGKDYTKMLSRQIKCYTNDGNSLDLYINGTFEETISVTNHIGVFTATDFDSGDIVLVTGSTTSDTFTFA